MSLRWRIASVLALAGAAMAVALGALTFRSTEQRLVDEIDRAISQTGELVVVANDRFPQRRQAFDVYSARRIGPSGEVLVTSFADDVPLGNGPEVVAADRRVEYRESVTAPSGERYRIHTLPTTTGSLQIARSLDETDDVLADLRRRTMLLVAGGAALLAVVGWLIAGRIAAPLRRLATSADEVRTTGRLDVSLPAVPAGGRDEVGQLTRAFSSMIEALRRSRAEQERLVQDAGHELRTPLTSLRTNLAVLQRHDDMSAEMRAEILADLDGEVGELTDLVNELVTVASGRLSSQPCEHLDLAELVGDVAQRVGRRRQRDIRVAGASGLVVEAPRAAIDRAVANLVDNACKFDPSGSPVDVSVATSAVSPDVVEVRVADRGPGLGDGPTDQLFERFHRHETARTTPGSGLGLAIVRDIVVAAGGSVVARDREGGGAVVGFDLPTVASDAPDPAGPIFDAEPGVGPDMAPGSL